MRTLLRTMACALCLLLWLIGAALAEPSIVPGHYATFTGFCFDHEVDYDICAVWADPDASKQDSPRYTVFSKNQQAVVIKEFRGNNEAGIWRRNNEGAWRRENK